MAHHKSAKKRIKTNAKRRAVNKAAISKIKTLTKKVFDSTDKVVAEKVYKEAVAGIDRMAVKGKIHKNTASRRKSALTRYVNSLAEAK